MTADRINPPPWVTLSTAEWGYYSIRQNEWEALAEREIPREGRDIREEVTNLKNRLLAYEVAREFRILPNLLHIPALSPLNYEGSPSLPDDAYLISCFRGETPEGEAPNFLTLSRRDRMVLSPRLAYLIPRQRAVGLLSHSHACRRHATGENIVLAPFEISLDTETPEILSQLETFIEELKAGIGTRKPHLETHSLMVALAFARIDRHCTIPRPKRKTIPQIFLNNVHLGSFDTYTRRNKILRDFRRFLETNSAVKFFPSDEVK